MRIAGFLLMPAGWIIVIGAVALLPAGPVRTAFTLAGVAVEVLGLGIVIHSHAASGGDEL
jgi:hypothetical protein